MSSKTDNKLLTILIINYILIIMHVIANMFPIIGIRLSLGHPLYWDNCYTLLTHMFIHISPLHLFSNILVFNILGILSLFNEDDWYHLVVMLVMSGLLAAYGQLYLSPRGLFGLINGFSGAIMGFMIYIVLSYKKHCILQLLLLIYVLTVIRTNYVMLYVFSHNIAVDAHLWGAIGGMLYRILYNILTDIYSRLNSFFYIEE